MQDDEPRRGGPSPRSPRREPSDRAERKSRPPAPLSAAGRGRAPASDRPAKNNRAAEAATPRAAGRGRPPTSDRPAKKNRAAKPAAPTAPSRRRHVTKDVAAELGAAARPTRAPKLELRMADAVKAYDRDRYPEAARILKPLADEAPSAAAVRELYGLTLYRMGRWAGAIKQLDAFRALTGSFDQHPVLADCYRALGRGKAVHQLWEELREASPSAEVVAEGRIVAAGSLADGGDVAGAIALLERARPQVKSPRLHHLRLWYALADQYERAGDIPRARETFRQIVRHDREFVDAAERVAALD